MKKFLIIIFLVFQLNKIKYKDEVILNLTEPGFKFVTCNHGHTPDVTGDCTRFQTENSSCCYFTYGQTTSCIYLGIRYLGSGQYGDLYIECNNYFVKFNKFIIFFLMFILL